MGYIESKWHSWQKELCGFMSLCTLLLTLVPGKEKEGSQWAVNLHWHSSWYCLLVLGKVKVTCSTCLSWVWPARDVSDAQLSDTYRSRQPESKSGLQRRQLAVQLLKDIFILVTHIPVESQGMSAEGKVLNSPQSTTKTKGLGLKIIIIIINKYE